MVVKNKLAQQTALTTIFIYGPPGSGKSSLGQRLASNLDLPFWDLDQHIEENSGMSIPQIFAVEGEAGFRAREKRTLNLLLGRARGVVALGGGSLLDPENRRNVTASGPVLCLTAPPDVLAGRLLAQVSERPLLSPQGEQAETGASLRGRLEGLLEQRAAHYASFDLRLDTGDLPVERAAWEAQVQLGRFHVSGMGPGYPVQVQPGGLELLGAEFENLALRGPVALVSDENAGQLYAARAAASLERSGYRAHTILIRAGEQHKTIQTVADLWQAFVKAGLERKSTVVALGGGVVGDLAGFAAATYLRGVPWVAVPTSLLAMADASLGGKTGADLPQGKNLVGAFHPPRLVLSDPLVLETLPQVELRAGMAEVLKAAIIGDVGLFAHCANGWHVIKDHWGEIVRRSMAVKIKVIQEDPFEQGQRAALNFGHTIGHAVELASGYNLRHGEAVAIGMALETRLAERMGLAQAGLAEMIAGALQGLGLPTSLPAGLDPDLVLRAMGVDKKRTGGKLLFALPARIGQVQVGCEVADLRWLVADGSKRESP